MNFQVFRIDYGTLRGANLAGSIFVLLNLSEKPYASPSENKLFIDASADQEREGAIKEFLRDLGFAPPEVLRVPIKMRVSPNRQTIEIGSMLKYTIALPEQRLPVAEVTDYLYPWLLDPAQGLTERVRYFPYRGGQSIQYAGTNAIFARFDISIR